MAKVPSSVKAAVAAISLGMAAGAFAGGNEGNHGNNGHKQNGHDTHQPHQPQTPAGNTTNDNGAQATGTGTGIGVGTGIAGAQAGASNATKVDTTVGQTTTTTVGQQTHVDNELGQDQNQLQGQQQSQDQANQQTNAQDNNNSQNIDASDNSKVKYGAASNAAAAAPVFIPSECKTSFSIAIGGGLVFAGYGNFSLTKSDDGEPLFTGPRLDKKGQPIKNEKSGEIETRPYTIPEVGKMDPNSDTYVYIFNHMATKEDLIAGACLVGHYQAKREDKQMDLNNAKDIAIINQRGALAREKVRQAGAATVEKVKGVAAERLVAVKHACNASGVIVQTGQYTTKIDPNTLALPRDKAKTYNSVEHAACDKILKTEYPKADFSDINLGLELSQ